MMVLLPDLRRVILSSGGSRLKGRQPIAPDARMRIEALDWITIRTYLYEYEAVFARDLLVAHGIEARILDASLVGVAPHLSNAIGGVRLQVEEREREGALEVLAAPHLVPDQMMMPEEDEDEDEPEAEAPPSPGRLALRAFVAAALSVLFLTFLGTAVCGG